LNIWTVFFLVLSAVILASPLLSASAAARNGSDSGRGSDSKPDWDDDELELDLALGRLARDDYDILTGRKANHAAGPAESVKGDDGSFPES
jgi:hypothetical protein